MLRVSVLSFIKYQPGISDSNFVSVFKAAVPFRISTIDAMRNENCNNDAKNIAKGVMNNVTLNSSKSEDKNVES